jgi:hypothetical protein
VRKLEALRNTPDGRDYTLSLVPWGLLRRWSEGSQAKIVFGFVPRYELAILSGTNVFAPCRIFRFVDKATAQEMYHKIAQAIMRDGLNGTALASVMGDADSEKVHAC